MMVTILVDETTTIATTTNNNNVISAGYGYCWSHEHVPQRGTEPHNSATCCIQKPGCKSKATSENKLGGKTHVWKYSANE